MPLLNQAERPAILAGRGCCGLGPLLLDFAAHWESGITLTMPAKGIVPDAHPLVLGGLGPGGSEASSRMLAEADLLLIAGATWWPELYLPDQLAIVQIDAVPANIGGRIPVAYGLVGDLVHLLPRLQAGLQKREKPCWQRRLQELKADWQATIAPEYEAEGAPVPPGRAIKAIEAAVDADAVICLDVGDHTVWFNRLFNGTRQKILVSGGWRSMGKVIVFKNDWLAMERDRMELMALDYGVTRLHTPDFAAFARACGGKGYTVHDSAELDTVLPSALHSPEPAIVQIHTAAPIFPGLVSQLTRENQQQERSELVWV
ncbi:MAG TPA: hypothetical protein GXX33_07980 [Firmicutes bacterium]|nr:hypothetical protein [Bacillota bacterium]